jgi:hypothetical protein
MWVDFSIQLQDVTDRVSAEWGRRMLGDVA